MKFILLSKYLEQIPINLNLSYSFCCVSIILHNHEVLLLEMELLTHYVKLKINNFFIQFYMKHFVLILKKNYACRTISLNNDCVS